MRADFSRIRFTPAKQYTAVLEQQGRVALDADANEQQAIDAYLRDTTNIDVIGDYGGPIGDAGFEIRVVNNDIVIGSGRYYVEGLLVENRSVVSYGRQPWLLHPAHTAQELLRAVFESQGSRCACFRLEVWQRLVTALDDPCLREPALGQADTTARLQTVWRVVGALSDSQSSNASLKQDELEFAKKTESGLILHQDGASVLHLSQDAGFADPIENLSPCCQDLYGQQSAVRTGAMSADTGQGDTTCGCQPIPAAGYQGLENQLYRVEIHTPGDVGTATFKWSRENGSVVTNITHVNGRILTLGSLGPDANLGFQPNQWVELTDDSNLFSDPPNQPGELYQIQSLGPGPLQVTLATPVTGIDTALNARMRRWDQTGAAATAAGMPLSAAATPLENGIEIAFRSGTYQAGDYWTIPARAAGSIDWPPCGSDGNLFQPPSYTRVYSAPLACISRGAGDANSYVSGNHANSRFAVQDCRLLFPPLTALTQQQTPAALHLTAASFTNDDIVTVDTFLAGGLWFTLDQATTCPWGGGNFKVSAEVPLGFGDKIAGAEGQLPGYTRPTFPAPAGTDAFTRNVIAFDPPWGVTVAGKKVSWLLPTVSSPNQVNYGAYLLFDLLNAMFNTANFLGFVRLRVRLIGSAIYGDGDTGSLYLDGQTFGLTGSRALDASQDVSLAFPSGAGQTASDFEGWFYLAPSLLIASVVIQGVENGQTTTISALKVLVNYANQVIGYQIGESAAVTNLQALVTLNYPPIAPATVSLSFSGPGAGSVVTIASSVTVAAGQTSFTTPINIPINPGAGVKDTVTLTASVPTALGQRPYDPAPTLTISGTTPPPQPIK